MFIVWKLGEIQFIGLHLPPMSGPTGLAKSKAIFDRAMAAADREPGRERIVLGDFNVKLAHWYGGPVHHDGEELKRHMESKAAVTFVRFPPGTRTYIGDDRKGKSVLDHFAVSSGIERPVAVALADPEQWVANSDHVVIELSFETDLVPEVEVPEYKRLNLRALEDEEVQEEIAKEMEWMQPEWFELRAILGESFDSGHLGAQQYVDRVEKTLREMIVAAAEKVIGTRTCKVGCIPRFRPTQELIELTRRRRQLKRRLSRMPMHDLEHGLVVKELKMVEGRWLAESQSIRTAAFQDYFRELNTELAPILMRKMKTNRKRRFKQPSALRHDPAAMEGHARFYEDHFVSVDGEEWDALRGPDDAVDGHLSFGAIETARAIKMSANGKAPGGTGFVSDLLKVDAERCGLWLGGLFHDFVKAGKVPTNWKEAMIVPVPKKSGAQAINEHRPISLTEHIRKIFERVLKSKLEAWLEPLNMSQCGFRALRSTIDQAASLDECVRHYVKVNGRRPQLAFLDIKAAYDSVHRGILWDRLVGKGVPKPHMRMLVELFDFNHSKVVVGGFASRQFHLRAGLLQGSILSPLLYSTFIDGLADQLNPMGDVSMDGVTLSSFFYADDIALIADCREKMQELLDCCTAFARKHHFVFNVNKCEAMVDFDHRGPSGLFMNGVEVPKCQRFKYLGFDVGPYGIMWKEHAERMAVEAERTAQTFRDTGFNAYGMPGRVKLLAYKCFIRSKMEYGLAIAPPDKAALARLEKAQRTVIGMMETLRGTFSGKAPLVFMSLAPMSQRRLELSARWGLALERKVGSRFLVDRAQRQARGEEAVKSPFFELDRNPIWVEFKARLAVALEENPRMWWGERMKLLEEVIIAKRVECLEELRAALPRGQSMRVDAMECKPEHYYRLSYMRSYRDRRLVVLWMMGRVPGVPKECRVCGGMVKTGDHLMECSGRGDIDRLGRDMEFHAMVAEIRQSLDRCVVGLDML
jgi:hypothetical protein